MFLMLIFASAPPPPGFEADIHWPGHDITKISPDEVVTHGRNALSRGDGAICTKRTSALWFKLFNGLFVYSSKSSEKKIKKHIKDILKTSFQFNWNQVLEMTPDRTVDVIMPYGKTVLDKYVREGRMRAIMLLHKENVFGDRKNLLYSEDGHFIDSEQSGEHLRYIYRYLIDRTYDLMDPKYEKRIGRGFVKGICKSLENLTKGEWEQLFSIDLPVEQRSVLNIAGVGITWDPHRPGRKFTSKEFAFATTALKPCGEEQISAAFFDRYREFFSLERAQAMVEALTEGPDEYLEESPQVCPDDVPESPKKELDPEIKRTIERRRSARLAKKRRLDEAADAALARRLQEQEYEEMPPVVDEESVAETVPVEEDRNDIGIYFAAEDSDDG